MKQLKNICLLIFTVIAMSSCTKELDLSLDEQLLLDTQKKLEKLDKLYNLAFEDPLKADKDFQNFVQNELLTEDENFLSNQNILWRKSMTDLAIRMNKNFVIASDTLSNAVIFDLYRVKFETEITNKIIFSELPQQLKKGERLKKFTDKLAEIDTYFVNKIKEFKKKNPPKTELLNKNFVLLNHYVFSKDYSKIYIINFDFIFKKGGVLDASKFFFFPYIPTRGINAATEQKELIFKPKDLQKSAEYVVYNNKIFFHFHFKTTYDPLEKKGDVERQWIYEYNYKIENDGSLTLFNPKVSLLRFPLYVSAGPKSNEYKNYLEGLKSYTLKVK